MTVMLMLLFLPCCPVASSLASLSPQSGTGPDPACPTTTTTTTTSTTTSSLTTSSVDENSNSPNVFSTPKRPSHLHITSPLLPRRDGDETNETAVLTTQSSPCSLLLTSTSLSLPSPIASDFELSVLERFDQLMASLGSFTANHSGLFLSALTIPPPRNVITLSIRKRGGALTLLFLLVLLVFFVCLF